MSNHGNFPDVFFNKYETVQEKVVYPDGRVEMILKNHLFRRITYESISRRKIHSCQDKKKKKKESFCDIQNEIAEQSKKSVQTVFIVYFQDNVLHLFSQIIF